METPEILAVSSDWIINNTASLVTAIIVLTVGWFLANWASKAVTAILPRARGFDKNITPLLRQIVRYVILLVALMIALNEFGVQTTSLLAVMGAAGLAIALALQGTLSNVAAGVMVIWQRPLQIGEFIDGSGVSGTVVEVGLFGTRLRTADGVFVYVPNSQLWDSAITNYSREPRRRLDVKIGISYDADIAVARKELMKIANAEQRLLPDPAPVVYVDELGDSAVVIMLRCWVPTPEFWDVKFSFTEKAKLAFDKAGIEIPYNKLDLQIKEQPVLSEET